MAAAAVLWAGIGRVAEGQVPPPGFANRTLRLAQAVSPHPHLSPQAVGAGSGPESGGLNARPQREHAAEPRTNRLHLAAPAPQPAGSRRGSRDAKRGGGLNARCNIDCRVKARGTGRCNLEKDDVVSATWIRSPLQRSRQNPSTTASCCPRVVRRWLLRGGESGAGPERLHLDHAAASRSQTTSSVADGGDGEPGATTSRRSLWSLEPARCQAAYS